MLPNFRDRPSQFRFGRTQNMTRTQDNDEEDLFHALSLAQPPPEKQREKCKESGEATDSAGDEKAQRRPAAALAIAERQLLPSVGNLHRLRIRSFAWIVHLEDMLVPADDAVDFFRSLVLLTRQRDNRTCLPA
jgi:hypothetical protein